MCTSRRRARQPFIPRRAPRSRHLVSHAYIRKYIYIYQGFYIDFHVSFKPCNQVGQPTSDIRLIFSPRSRSLNPKSLFSPNRTLSPSSRYAATPRLSRCCSRAVAMVDLPLADRPVNQSVKPCWWRSAVRSLCVSEGCHVMFLKIKVGIRWFCGVEVEAGWNVIWTGQRRGAHLRCHFLRRRRSFGKVGGDDLTKAPRSTYNP